MKNFGVFLNPVYKGKNNIFKKLQVLQKKAAVNFYHLGEQSGNYPNFIRDLRELNGEKLDCILVFGGDGTILSAVKFSLRYNAALLGINIGKLGFLSESNFKELEKSIENLKKNRYKIQKRMLLDVHLKRDKKILFSDKVLNDVVINKGVISKLIDIKITCNRRFVLETRCDGILAATPTGSTAYSLSAGGPILSPIMEAIVVAALNPHVLSVRPMVFAANDNLKFKLEKGYENSILQLDGKNSYKMKDGDEVIITSDTKKVEFIKLSNKTFYQILRKKLHMGRK
ncbi:MAG: NAD(+)/NADH kinase [Candidatus Cloacimonadota bacterium]|nr:NAD(+)/NADH kinase [Candidatus Cloacimonadota bacterium]